MNTLFETPVEYRVLTLWQPWASLLVYRIKKIETRPAPTSWTCEKGVYLIHAASKWTKEQAEICLQEPFKSELEQLGIIYPVGVGFGYKYYSFKFPMGQIIGAIEVAECNPIARFKDGSINYFTVKNNLAGFENIQEPELSFGNYSDGRYAWICKNSRVLAKPIPYKGGQGYYQRYKGDANQLKFL